mmetsp:Transcript_60390/g.168739  ORF Transcript_60390/g.168739 Transcript_60390/m.168739 type:complete len:202 (+) Transcript_60390:556-1161(+)
MFPSWKGPRVVGHNTLGDAMATAVGLGVRQCPSDCFASLHLPLHFQIQRSAPQFFHLQLPQELPNLALLDFLLGSVGPRHLRAVTHWYGVGLGQRGVWQLELGDHGGCEPRRQLQLRNRRDEFRTLARRLFAARACRRRWLTVFAEFGIHEEAVRKTARPHARAAIPIVASRAGGAGVAGGAPDDALRIRHSSQRRKARAR